MINEVILNIYNNKSVEEFFKKAFCTEMFPIFSNIFKYGCFQNKTKVYSDEIGNIHICVDLYTGKSFTKRTLANYIKKFINYKDSSSKLYGFFNEKGKRLEITYKTLMIVHDICLEHSLEKLLKSYTLQEINSVIGVPNNPFMVECTKIKNEKISKIEELYQNKKSIYTSEYYRKIRNHNVEFKEKRQNLIDYFSKMIIDLNKDKKTFEPMSLIESYLENYNKTTESYSIY